MKPSVAVANISQDDVPADPPNDEVFTSVRWTVAEQTALFTYLFGSDSDDIHGKWLKNKDRVYKKVLSCGFLFVCI